MDNNTSNPLYNDPQTQVQNTLEFNSDTLLVADPLALDIPDEELGPIVDKRIKDSQKFYQEKYNLFERRSKNETYRFGRQIAELEKKGKIKDYETRSADNVIYEIESSIKPLAMSKLPDIIITPGGEDPDRIESAKNLTKVVDDQNKKREQREALGLAFSHLPVYFTAFIKARWDPKKGKDGDMCFETIHPEYMIVDHLATDRNPDNASYYAQIVPMSVQDVIMKWPKMKEKFLEKAKIRGAITDIQPSWRDMASEVKIYEVWFDWYKRAGRKELLGQEEAQAEQILEPEAKWECVSGVLWKYDDLILDKKLDPNYDHTGERKLVMYDDPQDETTKHDVDPQQLLMTALSGQPLPDVQEEQVYHNYFDRPHKPYYMFGYEQWGKIAYDETSRIEQNIRNQENLDDQNKTILDQLKTRVKHIWGADSGMRKADIQRLDMDNPKMDVRVEGDPNAVHKAITPERPDSAQFNALSDTRSRMYALAHSTAIRGNLQSSVATSNQIAREADFTVSDDVTENTINAACEWIAQWQMQFIKLRYTNDHLKEILGAGGETTYIRLRRDTISDGMEVRIKSSSTDKLKAQRNAMETAGLGAPFTNPIDFFHDMDMDDPEGRTERGVLFAMDPMTYYTKFVLNLQNTQQMAGAVQAMTPPMTGMEPQPQGAPQQPNVQDTTNVATAQPAFPEGSPRAL